MQKRHAMLSSVLYICQKLHIFSKKVEKLSLGCGLDLNDFFGETRIGWKNNHTIFSSFQ